MQAVLIECFLLRGVGAGDISACTQRVGDKYRGLLLNHHHIILDAHLVLVLEVHVVLLPFADGRRHLVEPFQYLRQLVCRHLG